MFCGRRKQQQNESQDVEVEVESSSSPQQSGIVEKDPKQVPVVRETPTTSATTDSTPSEAPKRKTKWPSWWHSVDIIKEFEGGEAGVQDNSPSSDLTVSSATQTEKKKKKYWWCRPFRNRNNIDTVIESTEIDFNVESTNVQSTQAYSNVETSNPDFIFMSDYAKRYLKSQNVVYIKDVLPPDALKYRPYAQVCHNGSKQAESESVYGNLAGSRETLSTEKLVCLGLPNLAQTCYMNSTLQGLLTLTHFMQEVHNQHTVWNFHPQSELIRLFENVELCHSSTDRMEKKCVLFAFKKSIAELNSQFDDDSQKDVCEFLSCVLTKTRSLSVDLHQSAVNMGMTCTCPVNAHMAFQMLSTRSCMGCGLQSKSIKDYVNLSLDLAYRGSVSQFLQSYLKKNQLEYCCKSCSTQESSQQWSFVSLPNVLIIQLQRFTSTKSDNLRKLDIRVEITRELMLNSDSNTTEQTHYSLVSIISHLGSSAVSGHFICDGAYRQQESGDMTDRWLTYIDNIIKESTAKFICQLRQKTAYVLFYEKQQ
ncbi:ubiquitin carboxyl-terminal hydrolase 8-like isoform X3 [Sparus aurata]|uniref:Ubiquitin carboxyl-terminal hydrolase n=1 Tax=Sparus aurata TaxID=8175 RepID=A0A671Y6F6_SPAAU|nr:ubiquitin carboxyl-terminal hydrolase 8-like isoform X3 [Sparus aurata]